MSIELSSPTAFTRAVRPWTWLRENWPVLLTTASFLPLLLLHLNEVNARPHYEFVPLLVPGAALLVWERCRNLGALKPGDRIIALAQAASIWLLLASAILFVSSWLGAVAALLAIPAAAYAFGGRRLAAGVIPAMILLALAIPPPFQLDYALVGRLQGLVSRCAGMLLDLLGIDHVMEGNVIDLGTRQLLVDQACSGIYSLFTLCAFTLFYVLWTRASLLRSLVLLGSAIFWVVMGNVLRVAAIALLAARFEIDATAGKKHTALGLAGFAFMLVMVVCTDRLLSFGASIARVIRHHGWGTSRAVARASWRDLIFRWDEVLERRESQRVKRGIKWRQRLARKGDGDDPQDDVASESAGSPTTGPTRLPQLRRTWPGTLAGGLAFAMLLIPQTRLPALDWDAILADRAVEVQAFATLGEDAMPRKVGAFERLNFNAETRDHDLTWGEHSRSWNYKGQTGVAAVSLDYPFVGWHELTECYNGRGFQVIARRVVPESEGGPAVMTDLSRRDGRYARLIFGLFDRQARPLTPPDGRDFATAALNRIQSWRLTDAPPIESSRPTHQVQVIQMSAAPFGDDPGTELLELYRATVAGVRKAPLNRADRTETAR